ncbi:MAG TPA: amidohydrolase family protein [Thermoanaerobaculia bacterium]
MRLLAPLLSLLLLPAPAPTPAPTAAPPLLFIHVTAIDATGAPGKPDQTVLVQSGQIAAMGRTGSVEVPAGARVIDATGKYLIPGLWDMHSHLGEREATLPLLYLALGVTGIRDMGSDLDFALEMRRAVEHGKHVGPRIVTAGLILDNAPPDWPFRRKVSNAEEARTAVADLQRRGVDFLKVHNNLPRDAYFAIAEEARRRGLPFAGHVPLAVTIPEAIQAGQASIEHLSELPADSARSPPDRHAQPGAIPRPRQPRHRRARQARRPGPAGRRSPRGHPQHPENRGGGGARKALRPGRPLPDAGRSGGAGGTGVDQESIT